MSVSRSVAVYAVLLAFAGFLWARPAVPPESLSVELGPLSPDNWRPIQCGKTYDFVSRFELAPVDFFENEVAQNLCMALKVRDAKRFKQVLARTTNLNLQGKHGFTVLHWAFLCGDLPAFRTLLEKGADPDIRLTEDFLGLKAMTTLYKGDSVIHCLSKLTLYEFWKLAVQHSDKPDHVNRFGISPLFDVVGGLAFLPRVEFVDVLIESGADVNARCDYYDGAVPMDYPLANKDVTLLLRFLVAGADPDKLRVGRNEAISRLIDIRKELEAKGDTLGIHGANAAIALLRAPSR